MKLSDIFLTLVKIPSPSMAEDNVAKKIIEILSKYEIPVRTDEFGNVIAYLEATDNTKKPLLLSAHMDVVGDDSPVNVVLNGTIFETDKQRTLGADDKAGIAAAIKLAIDLKVHDKDIKHGGLELVFTRDEEVGMTGIRNIDFSKLKSEYILVIDSDSLGKFEISGASYTKLNVYVKTKFGGHSGIDIADPNRINAAKVIADYVSIVPQGVINEDELGVVTSCNLGAIVGGGIERTLKGAQKSKEPCNYIAKNCTDNVINTSAAAHFSIRSTNKWLESELIDAYKSIAKCMMEKYKGLVDITIKTETHLKSFEKSDDNLLVTVAKRTANKIDFKLKVQSFHAAAETHIYANQKNADNKVFKPVLFGVANISNMHSPDEQIEMESFIEGYHFLKEFFKEFNEA